MSRIGKHPIAIPAGVDVTIDGSTVTVKGPKGTQQYERRHGKRRNRSYSSRRVKP